MRLAEARQDPGAVDPRLALLEREPEFDRVPIQPRHPVKLPELHCLATEKAKFLHEIGDRRLGQQRHVPEHVVEHVGFLEIVELACLADEIARGEAAVGEMLEEHVIGDQPGDRDHRPAGERAELLVELGEIGDARARQMQHLEALLELMHRAAVEQRLLAREQRIPHPMILVGQLIPMLRDGPVSGRAGRRNRRREGAVSLGVHFLLCFVHVGFQSQKETPPGGPGGVRAVSS